MKNFKKFISEFRIPDQREPNGRGGEDPHEELAKIANTIPFTHRTNEEDEFRYSSTLDAAKKAAESYAMHERGLEHAQETARSPHMTEYFLSSIGTHEDLLDHVANHLYNHENVPERLKPHVDSFVDSIVETQKSKVRSKEQISKTAGLAFGQQGGFGEFTYRTNYSDAVNGRHPHLMNDTFHLATVIRGVDPEGYFISREEKSED